MQLSMHCTVCLFIIAHPLPLHSLPLRAGPMPHGPAISEHLANPDRLDDHPTLHLQVRLCGDYDEMDAHFPQKSSYQQPEGTVGPRLFDPSL